MDSVTKEGQVKSEKGYVGIDTGKRRLDVCRLKGTKPEFVQFGTDIASLKALSLWLKATDRVAIEAGNQAFRIARYLKAQSGCHVIVLNPGDLAQIYRSLKKTDREDSLKLARMVARIPEEELPVVSVPDEETEDLRRLLRELESVKGSLASEKNNLHAIYTHAGLTDLKKTDILGKKRSENIALLPERFRAAALRTLNSILHYEERVMAIETEMDEHLRKNIDYVTIAMSIPGVGPVTTLTMLAFLGDCSRFSSPGQVSYYAGLVPRVDISGDTVRYGNIIKRGNSLLRRPLIQAAWALIRSGNGGPLKDFYERLYPRIGKKKAIVAVARKMLEVFYTMMRNGECYRSMPISDRQKKLKMYALV